MALEPGYFHKRNATLLEIFMVITEPDHAEGKKLHTKRGKRFS
jgi:hypothetical protein